MSFISSFGNVANGGTTVTTAAFTRPAAATYALLLVSFRGGDGPASTLTSATLGGINFTLDALNMRRFDGFQAVECGYILAADLPSGSVTLTATRGAAQDGFSATVLFFDDAAQDSQNPPISLNGAASSPADPFVTPITPADSAVLVDIIATSASVAGFTPSAGQTEVVQWAGDSLGTALSIKTVTAGLDSMGWDTGGNTNRTSHIVVAILADGPAGAIALTGTATDSITEVDIVNGGRTIILTLTGDTFVSGAAFDNVRQDIIDGLDGE